jgi:hypothetical protein
MAAYQRRTWADVFADLALEQAREDQQHPAIFNPIPAETNAQQTAEALRRLIGGE